MKVCMVDLGIFRFVQLRSIIMCLVYGPSAKSAELPATVVSDHRQEIFLGSLHQPIHGNFA